MPAFAGRTTVFAVESILVIVCGDVAIIKHYKILMDEKKEQHHFMDTAAYEMVKEFAEVEFTASSHFVEKAELPVLEKVFREMTDLFLVKQK